MNDKTQISNLGKMLPQAIEAEQMVLGTCLCYSDSVHEIQLKPEMFYKEQHQKIYSAILELAGKSVCDIVTITDLLRKNNELENVGGPVFITKLTKNVISNKHIINHSLIVKEKYLLREYIRIGKQLIDMAFQEDLSSVIEFAESELFNVSNFIQTKEPKKINRCIDELLVEVQKIYNKEKL